MKEVPTADLKVDRRLRRTKVPLLGPAYKCLAWSERNGELCRFLSVLGCQTRSVNDQLFNIGLFLQEILKTMKTKCKPAEPQLLLSLHPCGCCPVDSSGRAQGDLCSQTLKGNQQLCDHLIAGEMACDCFDYYLCWGSNLGPQQPRQVGQPVFVFSGNHLFVFLLWTGNLLGLEDYHDVVQDAVTLCLGGGGKTVGKVGKAFK